jgi:hypothetical protein
MIQFKLQYGAKVEYFNTKYQVPSTEAEAELREYLARQYGIEDQRDQDTYLMTFEQVLLDGVIGKGLLRPRNSAATPEDDSLDHGH